MSASTASPLPASTGPAKVLVVEDDAIVTRDVTSILEEMGCEVAGVVREGEEAIRPAREQRLALVLMDIRLPDDEQDRAIVETILTLGRSLKLSVVAEGIENEQQLEALRDKGCEEAQGFHLARPQPAEELEALLEQSAREG